MTKKFEVGSYAINNKGIGIAGPQSTIYCSSGRNKNPPALAVGSVKALSKAFYGYIRLERIKKVPNQSPSLYARYKVHFLKLFPALYLFFVIIVTQAYHSPQIDSIRLFSRS